MVKLMNLSVNNKNIDIKLCNKFSERLLGLMFKKNINYGLLFRKCNSIHTFFMRENIDIIMTDKNNKILYIYQNLKPWRIILPKKNVYNVYELPKNTIKTRQIDDIKISLQMK